MYMIKIKILLNANFRNAQASKHALTKKNESLYGISLTDKQTHARR